MPSSMAELLNTMCTYRKKIIHCKNMYIPSNPLPATVNTTQHKRCVTMYLFHQMVSSVLLNATYSYTYIETIPGNVTMQPFSSHLYICEVIFSLPYTHTHKHTHNTCLLFTLWVSAVVLVMMIPQRVNTSFIQDIN